MDVAGKYAAKKIIGSKLDKYTGGNGTGKKDPYFEMVPDKRGKLKKVKKQIPDFIPEHDAQILAKAKNRAYHLDMCLFQFMGLRFGWSSVIGLVPEIGDVVDFCLALSLYMDMCKVECGLRKRDHATMCGNIAGVFLIGLVPIAGDLVDTAIRCNTRNVVRLEDRLVKHYGGETSPASAGTKSLKPISSIPDSASRFNAPQDRKPPVPQRPNLPRDQKDSGQRWRDWLGVREPEHGMAGPDSVTGRFQRY